MKAEGAVVEAGTKGTWIIGASGLLAGELARLIELHPGLHLEQVVSRESGRCLQDLHPQLQTPLQTVGLEQAIECLSGKLAEREPGAAPLGIFLGLPHGQSGALWKQLREALGDDASGLAVVDLSADFRLRDAALYEATYDRPHPDPEGEEGFVYGLPEFYRGRILESTRVAAPGCFATAMQLAVLPAAQAGKLDACLPWILNGVTGSSGSGSSPKITTHHPFRTGSYKAYSPTGHRHEAELQQALAEFDLAPALHFVPHSGPWSRGIYLTCSLPIAGDWTAQEAHQVFAECYTSEPFVEVLPEGAVPELRSVLGSNRASIGVFVRGQVLTVLLALDNTIKGGAGQALQCMNMLLGEPEQAGLPVVGLGY